jgi:hypothetical protein
LHKHHLCKKREEEQPPYVDYIVVAMSDSLDDQTTHTKVCSRRRYEQQKPMEKNMSVKHQYQKRELLLAHQSKQNKSKKIKS